MRVLIGVDGSQGSFAAVVFAGRLLSPEKDEITLYYSPPPVYVRTVADSRSAEANLQFMLAASVFDRAKQHLPKAFAAEVKTITGTRNPKHGLLVAADDCRADLIVVGARGVGPAKVPAVGSLVRHVVHHATVPILIVRGGAQASAKPLRVLLATGGLPEGQHAASTLGHFTWPPGSSGQTITVLESSTGSQIPQWLIDQLEDEQLAALGLGRFARTDEEAARRREELKNWESALPAIFTGHNPLIAIGHTGDQIVSAILDQQADLVVVGARRQGAIRRVLLGSTSEHVLLHAPCSVLVVRSHEQA